MTTFIIKNMGCKSNQFEGSVIRENLIKEGFSEVSDTKLADFFILNSCSVTHKSDKEALSILKKSKKDNPQIVNIITGCTAQIEKENLLNLDFVDIVIGNDEKFNMPEILTSHKKNSENFYLKDIFSVNEFHNTFLQDTTKTRASVKIQDGCNNRCAYCIIPFARGVSRCAKEDFIIQQIKNYEQHGFKEIMLTGIHIGQFKSQKNDDGLLGLLKLIEQETNIRYRLGSLNPLEISDKMLDFLSKSENFCPHFHLSLQSACNKTLKSMNRFYTVENYLELIEKISKMFYLPFIGSDIIAGFAGETQEDFETTVENLKKSKLTQIHTFPYSVRKGTQAEDMPNHLSDKEKELRANIIKQISKEKYAEFLQKNINSTQEILIEKKLDKKTGLPKGVTKNYLKVFVNDALELNSLQKIRIISIENDKILGEIVK